MIIPIRLESEGSHPDHSSNAPIVTFPPEERSSREATFGDILIPSLSKYFSLRNSKRKDLRSLLAKEHPIHIENFKTEADKYELELDVHKFKPEEISVKITDDWISILGQHEEKTDKHNYKKQEFLRRYSLPREVNANNIKCELSSDGHLLISAPKQQQKIKITEVTVPIARTNDAVRKI